MGFSTRQHGSTLLPSAWARGGEKITLYRNAFDATGF
jgi:hypothetical protein